MVINEKLVSNSKIQRTLPKRAIHNLFIFNKSGICLYGRNFDNKYHLTEKQFISSFFSAITSFTKAIMKKKVKTIEMGNVKFVIIEKDEFFYCLLCDSIQNLMILEEFISKVNFTFNWYIYKNKINHHIEHIYDEYLNRKIDDILQDFLSNEFDLDVEEKIKEFIELLSLNDELKGIILSTDKGNIIYSTLNQVNLRNFLKEVDFRVKFFNNTILKLFYTSKNEELIFSDYIEDLYFLILVFNVETKLGVAEYYMQKVVKFIKATLNK